MKPIKIVLFFHPDTPEGSDRWGWTLPDYGTDHTGGECKTDRHAIAAALTEAHAIHKKEHQANIEKAMQSRDLIDAIAEAIDAAK